eukprot:349396-Rhodomonas_salina.3
MSTSNTATRSSGTSKASAKSCLGVTSNCSDADPSPVPCSSSLLEDCNRKRRELERRELEFGLNVRPSSSRTRAKSTMDWETVKMLWPPVCVGVHSYEGLIQKARL